MLTEKKLVVIGGGPAGLAAAWEAARQGCAPSDILILERDSEPGGILNQCIHAGFGLHLFGEEMTGPEYAGRFIRQVCSAGIEILTDAMVLSLSSDKVVTFVSPSTGFCRVQAGAVILAMGCRERTRGALNIPGTRPAGVFSAGTAQRFVNIEGHMPGSRIVILGSGDIGLIMARRLTLEGAKVLCVCELMPYSSGLGRNIVQCLDDFGIPLMLSHTVTKIHGRERVEGVTIAAVDGNRRPIPETEEYIACDTLLLSVGLIPENELTRNAGVEMDRVTGGAVVNERMETSAAGIFACGNALQVHDLVDFVTMEAYRAGHAAADYLNGTLETDTSWIQTQAGQGVRYIVPQRIGRNAALADVKLFFRVTGIYRDVMLTVTSGERTLKSIKKRIVTPGEMESISLEKVDMTEIGDKLEVSVCPQK